MIPGELVTRRASSSSTPGARRATLRVMNTGDRPIQVGSHFHFADVNDGAGVRPRRGARASGSTCRPGRRCASSPAPTATCTLVALGGARKRAGTADRAMTGSTASATARCYGPTVGDKLRLADTDLWLEVEEDRCVGGDEAVFGGGKTIRESMLQGTRTRAEGAPDLVITNVVVLDHWGVVKCDVGDQGRPDRRARQGGQPGRDGRRRPGAGDRADDGDHRRRGPDPHRGRRSTATCTSSARRSSTRRSRPG